MSDIAIRVENLGKQYRIGTRQRGYKTLRESLVGAFAFPFRRIHNSKSKIENRESESIWALKDVSFHVKQGEVIGIIGRNGAGKSTLLKILSRITKPTEGRAVISGRVSSLLEVGTGFHSELTGRENIYLNGAILGMHKAEITRNFDQIVAFAEIEKFIDTPVKHYSTGMYLRLAFAVAAHLDPEILMVDEVLAVGDAGFQKKCLGKMEDVSKTGRTILFVSHNMAAVRHLCGNAILLSQGQMLRHDDVKKVVADYESLALQGRSHSLPSGTLFDIGSSPASERFAITRIEVLDEAGRPKPFLATWDPACFRIHYQASEPLADASAEFWLMSMEGVVLLLCSTRPDSNVPMAIRPGPGWVDCIFPQWPFAAGRYLIDAALAIPMKEYLCRLPEPVPLDVQPRDVFSSGTIVPQAGRALVAVPHTWSHNS